MSDDEKAIAGKLLAHQCLLGFLFSTITEKMPPAERVRLQRRVLTHVEEHRGATDDLTFYHTRKETKAILEGTLGLAVGDRPS